MHLRVFKEDVIDGLQKAANIIPAKTGAAYLRSIWLKAEAGALHVLSTDSNIEFRGRYTGEVMEEGLAGVQGRAFVDLLKKLPSGEITLRLDKDSGSLQIEQGRRKYKLPVNDPTWFQNFSDFPEAGSVYWSGDFVQELIDKLSYCISDEDTMEAIACMSMKPMTNGTIESCGLNGHQFSMQRFMNDELHSMLPQDGILVQKKYLGELKKWLGGDEIELNIDNKRLFFRRGDKRETFSLPLSYYQYPDYNNFLSKLQAPEVSTLEVDRKEIIEALDRLLIFNTENNRCTYFTFNGAEVELSSQGQEVGTANEAIEAQYQGDIKRIAFPTRNLIEILNHYQSETLKFLLTGSEGPCGLQGNDDPEYTVIIMPMKIVEETYYSEEEV
ncbi:DNA polymerase III subunit beta [Desulfovibrio subterraneus]|jgi:DNA polymerase-3 subunit beta|uniref:Beta sliding clamp n=1 Tax=Desulfovibrio subterraneus TaxID=2718620 RepID=A0A7J0BM41_9BACT|nr:DNA polymerase III subunit beta [Desulfovibrio subterraneus]WBF66354.1 DNA polymerase III subunit beta [Desulfovibrio subterraneus]GFM34797.1 DNA polymerase III subunit beta [Desulfovibrio subterraneus]